MTLKRIASVCFNVTSSRHKQECELTAIDISGLPKRAENLISLAFVVPVLFGWRAIWLNPDRDTRHAL